ncbi:MAG TPA: histidinol-phosphate transaminase [Candidatus Limnocylindrales bacterium]|nr:histidinol-phosphate transaminase [Candidatus Limnocylindrales bacterium]
MSPTPTSMSDPTAPASYSWEATNEEVARRYGLPVESIVRFDLNTSPAAPAAVAELLAAGRFETSLSEYPPSDYRRLTAAAAAVYGVPADEILVGAGADEILDLVAKAFLGAGDRAVIPTPSYAMYRVLTEQRGASVSAVPRLGPDAGRAIDVDAVRSVARDAAVVWLCNPNNPTGRLEPAGQVERLLDDLAADAGSDGRRPPIVVLDEAYSEFVGRSLLELRAGYPRLVVVRTVSKAYALAGLRVGFAIAPRATLERIEPYRPPGSVSTVSVSIATAILGDRDALASNLQRVEQERARLAAGLEAAGWRPEPSVTNFLLVPFEDAAAAAAVAEHLLRAGLVPRTFPADHPLANSLRLTVRDRAQDDRLLAAAQRMESTR